MVTRYRTKGFTWVWSTGPQKNSKQTRKEPITGRSSSSSSSTAKVAQRMCSYARMCNSRT